MKTPSISIKILADTGGARSNLTSLTRQFQRARGEIESSMQGIDVFRALKKSVQELSEKYAAAQEKVKKLASELKNGGTTEMQGRFKKARESAAKLRKELADGEAALHDWRGELKKSGVSTRTLAAEQTRLKKSLAAVEKEYASLSRVASSRDFLGLKSHRAVRAEIFAAQRAYVELRKSGTLTTRELAQAKVALNRRIGQLKEQTNGWKSALSEARMELSEIAAAGVVFVKAYQLSVKFESAMANVRKTVGGTDGEIAALASELRRMSTEIPVGAERLAEIAATAGQLGIASQDITAFTGLVAKMSTAFDMTAEDAAESVGKIKNIFRLNMEEIEEFGDAVNRLGNTTSAKEREIVEVMTRIGGSAKQFGLAREQAAALSAAMVGLTKSPEIAATAINALLRKMQTAASGTKEFKEGLQAVGFSADQMARLVREDPQAAINILLDSFEKLDGMERANVLTNMFGAEHQDEIAALVTGLKNYKSALGQVADKTAVAGSMTEEFATKAGTSESRLVVLKNTAMDIWRSIGDGMKPLIDLAVEFGIALLQPVAALTRMVPHVTAAVTAFAAWKVAGKHLGKVLDILRMAFPGFAEAGTKALGRVDGAVQVVKGSMGGVLSKLTMLGLAFSTGWDIGTWLNRFDVVKKAGIAMTAGIHKGLLRLKQGWAWLTGGDVEAVKQQIASVDAIYAQMFADIDNKAKESAATRSAAEKEVTAVAKSQAALQQAGQKEMLDTMKKEYQGYVDTIQTAQEKITERTVSLTEKLREMRREEMSDKQAWQDRKQEADDYYAKAEAAREQGQKALEAGDQAMANLKFDEAEEAAGKAMSAYQSLHRDVTDGGQVIATSAANLKTATDGMQRAAEVANAANNAQIKAASEALDSLSKKADLSSLTEGMDAAKQTWFDNWQKMQAKAGKEIKAVEDGLIKLVDKDRTVWVNIKARQSGFSSFDTKGMKEEPLKKRSGGHLPGYGGGDRIHALLEAGEFVMRKEAVKKLGVNMLHRLNSLQLPAMPKFQLGGPVLPTLSLPSLPRFKDGGAVSASAPAPTQVIELRLNTARLTAVHDGGGHYGDVYDFIDQLKRAQVLA